MDEQAALSNHYVVEIEGEGSLSFFKDTRSIAGTLLGDQTTPWNTCLALMQI